MDTKYEFISLMNAFLYIDQVHGGSGFIYDGHLDYRNEQARVK